MASSKGKNKGKRGLLGAQEAERFLLPAVGVVPHSSVQRVRRRGGHPSSESTAKSGGSESRSGEEGWGGRNGDC